MRLPRLCTILRPGRVALGRALANVVKPLVASLIVPRTIDDCRSSSAPERALAALAPCVISMPALQSISTSPQSPSHLPTSNTSLTARRGACLSTRTRSPTPSPHNTHANHLTRQPLRRENASIATRYYMPPHSAARRHASSRLLRARLRIPRPPNPCDRASRRLPLFTKSQSTPRIARSVSRPHPRQARSGIS